MNKKIIFPVERITHGVILLGLLSLFFMYVFTGIKFNDRVYILFIPVIFGVIISLYLIATFIVYDSEKMIFFSLLKIKVIKFDDISLITRSWERVFYKKTDELKYFLYHFDEIKDKKIKTRIFLPEDFETEKMKDFLEAIKKENYKFTFEVKI